MAGVTFAPLSSRILQRLPGARPLEACAAETVQICAAEEQSMRAAIFPVGDLERITGVHEFSAGLQDEIHLATRDCVHHTATLAMHLRNVVLSAGQLCNGRSMKRLTFGKVPFSPAWVTDSETPVALCSSAAGNDYFAHFLLDDASTALLGSNFGQPVCGGSLRPRTAQMLDYLQYCEVPCAAAAATRYRDLWLFTDHSQNSHRRARLQQLRDRLRSRFAAGAANAPAYIRRGAAGSRRALQNEAEVEALLQERGFNIVDPESMSAAEICQLLNQSPLVVGVEGSQLAHGVLNLRPGGGLLCIQPAARFNAVYRGFCNSLELIWGFVVAAGSADQFQVSPAALLATIDRMLEAAT